MTLVSYQSLRMSKLSACLLCALQPISTSILANMAMARGLETPAQRSHSARQQMESKMQQQLDNLSIGERRAAPGEKSCGDPIFIVPTLFIPDR
eukprot:scaffold324988_cov31-Prasinocladus_malaysianus.AAC.2